MRSRVSDRDLPDGPRQRIAHHRHDQPVWRIHGQADVHLTPHLDRLLLPGRVQQRMLLQRQRSQLDQQIVVARARSRRAAQDGPQLFAQVDELGGIGLGRQGHGGRVLGAAQHALGDEAAHA